MLYLTIETVLSGAGPSAVYPRTVDVLQPVQTAAIMEVLHCMVGIVRSGVVTTAVQVASRLGILWGVLYTTPEVQGNPAIVSLLAAWALTEPIRYSFYTFQLLKLPVPAPLLWIRYSLFIIAYPVRAPNQTQRASACLPAHRQLCVRACMYALRTPHAAARARMRGPRAAHAPLPGHQPLTFVRTTHSCRWASPRRSCWRCLRCRTSVRLSPPRACSASRCRTLGISASTSTGRRSLRPCSTCLARPSCMYVMPAGSDRSHCALPPPCLLCAAPRLVAVPPAPRRINTQRVRLADRIGRATYLGASRIHQQTHMLKQRKSKLSKVKTA